MELNNDFTTWFKFRENQYQKKVNLQEQLSINYGNHRSGWIFAIQHLAPLNNPEGIILDSFIERTFHWHPEGVKPHLEPWVGFIHVPHDMPDWFISDQSNETIFNLDAWSQSLPYCRGLFTLSRYHRNFLEKRLPVPVNDLLFAAEFPEHTWTWDGFMANKEKKIVQIGWWLRKLHAIYQLPQTKYKKIFLSVEHELLSGLMEKERELLLSEGSFTDDMYSTAETLSYLPNEEYDRLLCENIIFVCLYSASANNTVIECIARSTPLLINPIPPVIEYLGEEYPFYYNSLEEAAMKAEDTSLIHETHEYLSKLTIKEKLTGSYFLHSFANSKIYKNL
jgi:hypothetical protein